MKKLIFLTLLLTPFLLTGCNNNKQETSKESQVSDEYIKVLTEEINIMEEDSYQIQVEILRKGTIVFYSTSNEDIATVSDDGLVKGVSTGEAMITVRGGKNSYVIPIFVSAYQAKDSLQIVLDKDSFTIAKDDEYVLPLITKVGNEPVNAELSFDIEDNTIISINDKIVKGLKAGMTKCLVTATYFEEEVSKSFTVTVY